MKIYFAPLEGITTYPYRNLHRKYFGGVDKYFTPFLAPGPEQGMSVKEMRDILPENNDDLPVVPQILTNRAGDFLLAAKKLAELGYSEINLNLGCPSGTVTAKKKGSGFLLYPEELDRFFDEIFSDAWTKNGEFAVSVKTRIGKNSIEEWPNLMEIYNRYPICELTVHPRIQKEFYKGNPHWDVFAEALKNSKNPLVYNGDLFTAEKIRKFQVTFPQVSRIMIGRGLIRNPALAEELKNDKETRGDFFRRLKLFHDELLEHYKENMSGDRNVLFRMKDLWGYMLEEVPDIEKTAKKIRKSQHIPEYLAAVNEVFAKWKQNEEEKNGIGYKRTGKE